MFNWTTPRRPKAVAFDIIETVFPLDALRPSAMRVGLPPSGVDAWYAAALRDACALAMAGDFVPWDRVLAGALDQVLGEQGLAVPRGARAALVKQFGHLPARPDARVAFGTLARAGIGVVALSNGSAATTRGLLRGAGLADLVDHVVSVEAVKQFKPRAEAYWHAADVAGCRPKRLALVAVHPWDINGAKAAGLVTVYMSAERPYSGVMRAPDMVAATLGEAALGLAGL